MASLPDLPLEILFRMFELSPEIIPQFTSAYRDAYDLIYGDNNKYLSLLINNSKRHISNADEEGDFVLNNLKHGMWKLFATTGEEIANISYRLGKLHGEYNTETYNLTYNNGILDGPVFYIKNDIFETTYTGQFANGLPVGEWSVKNNNKNIKYIYHDDNRVVEKDNVWIGEHFYDKLPLLPKDFGYYPSILVKTDFCKIRNTYEYFSETCSKPCSALINSRDIVFTYGEHFNVSKQTITCNNLNIRIGCVPVGRHIIIPILMFKDGTLTKILYRNNNRKIMFGRGFKFSENRKLIHQDMPSYKLKKVNNDDFTYLTYYDDDEEVIKLSFFNDRFIRCEIPNMYNIEYINKKFIVNFMRRYTKLSTITIDNESMNIVAEDIELTFKPNVSRHRVINLVQHRTKRTVGLYDNNKLVNLSFDNIHYTYKNNDMIKREYDNIIETYDKEILISKEILNKKKIYYKDGEIFKIISYNDDGSIKSEKDFTYVNGKKIKGTYNGIVKLWVYYDNDVLAEYTEKNSIENSMTNIRYRKDGTILKISKVKDGKVIRRDTFDKNGEKI